MRLRSPNITLQHTVYLGLVAYLSCLIALCGALTSTASAETAAARPSSQALSEPASPSMEWLTGGDEARLAMEARLASPEAVVERQSSRTQYEDLKPAEAVRLAEQTFEIERPAWRGPTAGEPGARVVGYVGERAAQEVLPNGEHLLAASSVPLRSTVGSGRLEPLSLSLKEEGGVYRPANPLAPLSISRRAGGGVSLSYGVSVAPVQAAESEGSQVVGDQVVYPGTATDTDYMVQPIAGGGMEASWQLLSQQSPQEDSLRFDLPEGASLQMSSTVPGGAEVVADGERLYAIPPAVAREADGVTLPATYSVDGDVLSTHVELGESVAFPVMVDPLIDEDLGETYGDYGQSGGGGSWNGWEFYSSCGGCYTYTEDSEQLETYATIAPEDDYGEWYIYAPRAGTEHGSALTKVWLDFAYHVNTDQSDAEGGFSGDLGSGPIWTNNGDNPSDTKAAPMVRWEAFDEDLEFCAQGAGGYWGDPAGPLCNEGIGAEAFWFANVSGGFTDAWNETSILGATITYIDAVRPNEVKLEELPTGWVKYGPSDLYIRGHDEGTGMQAVALEIPPGYLYEGHPFFAQESSCSAYAGFDGCPESMVSSYIPEVSGLATGVHYLGVYAYSAAGNVREETPAPVLYVDHTPPHIEALSGSLVEEASKVGAGDYTLDFSAVDGSEGAPQSGVHTITVEVDGTKVDEVATTCPDPTGVPAAGCYGLSGSWTMEGERYGAGPHTVTVTAKDWAGNEATETLHITSDEAGYASMGPGQVNLQTGNFKLSSTDVQVTSPGATLSVGRSYESRDTTAGDGGPLGPQWSLSLPDAAAVGVWQNLRAEPNGNVEATLANGARLSFVRSGSSYTSPAGFQTETLSGLPAEKPTEYRLTNAAGDQTIFKHAEHEEEGLYTPSGVVQASGAGGLNKVSYTYEKTSEGVVEPTAVIAPSPAKLECVKEFVRGCRELTFNYASATTAKGEAPTEWGDYKSRLTRVYLHAWNPKAGEKGEMTTTAIAHYSYDSQGRLRAEWNPQLEPEPEKCVKEPLAEGCLATTYGYDSEGHVTALTAPGQESWAFTYGTSAADGASVADLNSGRLLKVLQAPASAGLWKGEPVANTTAPAFSGTAMVGVRMALSVGNWSGSPVAYGYRWEDCNREGHECSVIAGAVNGNYTPTGSDRGHTIVGQVIATNGAGSVVASSTPSSPVTEHGEGVSETKLSSPFECPNSIAPGPEGNMWFTDSCDHRVGKITSSYATTAYELPSGVCLGGITEGPDSNMWAVEECANKIIKITNSGTITEYSLPSGSHPANIVSGPNSELWFTEYGTSKIGKITTAGSITEYNAGASGSEPWGITVGPDGNLWCTFWGSSAIAKVTPSGVVTQYNLPAGSYPYAITSGPGGDLWFTEEQSSKIGKITTGGAITEYALPSSSAPLGIAAGPEGDVRVAEASSKIAQITSTGAVSEYLLPSGSDPVDIATASDDNHLWFTDRQSDAIGRITTSGETSSEGEAVEAQPGSSIDYDVPVSGAGAPHEMGSTEVAKWAQKDDPVAATAIFPPDNKPQGWPAGSYQRATVYYFDSQERTVNLASPVGGITTTEYNAGNDNVERTLSADNRAAVLKAGSKSVEVAEHLSTQSTYNTQGTELESALGPEHKIKLPGSSGEEVQARKHTIYSYDEGAPSEGGPYYLVTKTVEKAKLASGIEEDERAISTSYSGQEGLGWKLEEPTSTTTAPSTLGVTRSTLYSATTGAETETRSPSKPQISEYALPSGSGPFAITVGPDKNLWFTDYSSGKVGKITTAGAVKEYAADEDEPEGITSGPDGNLWFVEHSIRHVNHMTTSGELTTYTLSRTGTYNVGITAGPDSNLWFTESSDNYIAKINTKDEVQGEYALPSGSEPYGIAAGLEKDLWFAEHGNGKIGKSTTAGTISEYTLPSGSKPYELVEGPGERMWFTEAGTSKIAKITSTGSVTEYALPAGSEPHGITVGPEKDLWYTDYATSKIGRITASGEITEYALPAGSRPQGITAGPEGDLWFTEQGTNKIGKLNPSPQTGNQEARDSQTIYYSSGTEAGVLACENHPEWANLPCQTQPTHQPETAGLPELPVTTYTYNLYDEPEVTKSTSSGASRTETDSYDAAGRLIGKELSSTLGASMPKITYEYNKETGILEKQTAGEHAITSVYNTLGELTSYTDGDEGTTTYKHDIDGRTTEEDGPFGSQTYSYNETTGLEEKLTDSAAGTFTAAYDPEGNLASETLPNGMSACYTRNAIGEATGLEYRKAKNCEEGAVWFSDSVTPSIHEAWATQTSSLSSENYAYDELGRLTEVQETPAGKGCTVRLYGMEEDGNRTSLTTREPAAEGKCATEGGSVQTHGYDTANRLTDPGTQYNDFGDITTLPAADAGGSTLETSYYADGQPAEQRQEEVTLGYHLDPARRTAEITTTSSKIDSTLINHYAGEGATPAWTTEPGGKWARYIYGISDGLAAIQTDSETPVLQLSDLHGDIIGTAADEEAASKLLSSTNTTEYGVPTTGSPSRYSWLGTQMLPTELPSGIIAMGARSYVPQLGRFLQPDPKASGSENAYAYVHSNPLNETDPSGEWALNQTSGGLSAVGTGEGTQLTSSLAAGAITPPPVNTALEAAFWASPPWDQETAGNEEYEEYEEEGGEEYGGYQYISNHGGPSQEETHAHAASGLLEQAQGETALGHEGLSDSLGVPLCSAGAEGPCAHSIGGVHGHNVHGGGYYRGLKYVHGGGPCFGAGAITTFVAYFLDPAYGFAAGLGTLAACG